MSIYVCIDDTDNIDSIGTGEVADRIKAAIREQRGLSSTMTTRHQLLIHEDIPYTSHNSSMCFWVPDAQHEDQEQVIAIAQSVIEASMAEGSDPGLCVVCNPTEDVSERLMVFGKAAKTRVLTKAEAYGLAEALEIHLSEHGGTGGGIIGAQAGIGLRLSGNDGEVKGGLKDIDDDVFSVEELLARPDVTRVLDLTTGMTVDAGIITFRKRSKSILRDGDFTLLVKRSGVGYEALGKRMIRQMETDGETDPLNEEKLISCHKFEADVPEEQMDNKKTCHNCRHRRWQAEGHTCLLGL